MKGWNNSENRDYWLSVFDSDIEQSDLPVDVAAASEGSGERGSVEVQLTERLAARLLGVAKGSDHTLHVLLTAVWALLLAKYSNNDDVVCGTLIYRQQQEARFVNTILPLRHTIDFSLPVRQFLGRVKETVTGAVKHQNYPFDTLVYKLGLETVDHDFPLFSTMILLENIHDISYLGAKCPPVVAVFKREGESISASIQFDGRRYAPQTMERVTTHFSLLAANMLRDVNVPLSNVGMMPQQEWDLIMERFNRTDVDMGGDHDVCYFLDYYAQKDPQRVAFTHDGEEISYSLLWRRATLLAALLKERGIGADTLVGILMKRSIPMAVSILAVWMAGGAYIPLDTGNPSRRLGEILEDAAAPMVICDDSADMEELKNYYNGHALLYSEALAGGGSASAGFPPINIEPGNLAYVIYTSGSTGKPKGAMVEHVGMMNHIHAKIGDLGMNEDSVVAQNASHTFDISVWQLFAAIVSGGRTVIYGNEVVMEPENLLRRVQENGVTILETVPSYLGVMLEVMEAKGIQLPALRYLMVTGETVHPSLLDRWFALKPDIPVVNAYGPTEASDDITHHIMTGPPQEERVPVGKPLRNFNIYVVDRFMNPCPIGVKGEICVSGPGVGRGYLFDQEKTDKAFMDDPFAPGIRRLYKTGDLGCWTAGGFIDFWGRVDSQVKIRGFRIELGEIEHRLLASDLPIKEAAVTVRHDPPHEKCIVAYICGGVDVDAVREGLARQLPEYMVPAYFVTMETLPKTPNGKINRRALPQPDYDGGGAEYVAPKTDNQKHLASIWAEVLNRDRVGIRDNFFEIGADSITAIQVSARLQKRKLAVEIKDIFEYPCIEDLEPRVKGMGRDIPQDTVSGAVPLTPIQHWFFQTIGEDRHHFNLGSLISSRRGFDPEYVQAAFTAIIRHHDALRMVFRPEGESIGQWNRDIEEPLMRFEVMEVDGDAVDQVIGQKAAAVQGSLDLEHGPLVALTLFKTAERDYLLIVIHHMVVDGISWRVIYEDFSSGYKQAAAGEEIVFPEKSDSFQYWAAKLEDYAAGEEIQKELHFWESLKAAVCDPIPVDHEIPLDRRRHSQTQWLSLSLDRERTLQLLTDVHLAYNTEINDILLAALALALEQWRGLKRTLVFLEGHGREGILEDVYINRTVGWFTSLFPVVLGSGSGLDLGKRIKSVKESLRAIPHRGVGYGILRYLAPGDLGAEIQLPEEPKLVFNYLGQFSHDPGDGAFEIHALQIGETESDWNIGLCKSPNSYKDERLNIEGMVMDDQLVLTFGFNRQEYNEETVAHLLEEFRLSLDRVMEHCLQKEDTEMTASDFSVSTIDNDDVEAVYDLFDN
jgi:amino acid adenylation domain-containing protein/non-ribosomal peptide synthase protein (TIGR01720 family)